MKVPPYLIPRAHSVIPGATLANQLINGTHDLAVRPAVSLAITAQRTSSVVSEIVSLPLASITAQSWLADHPSCKRRRSSPEWLHDSCRSQLPSPEMLAT